MVGVSGSGVAFRGSGSGGRGVRGLGIGVLEGLAGRRV